jgi:hypothetical protein
MHKAAAPVVSNNGDNFVEMGVNRVSGRRILHVKDSGKELIEKVNVPGYRLTSAELHGGTCGVRLNNCQDFYLADLLIDGMHNPTQKDGTPGNDGHGIQIINSGGLIHYCWVYASRNGQVPEGTAEDLISIYGDDPKTENFVVTIEVSRTYGQSTSDTCTHICIDGPHPPKVRVMQNQGLSARCFLMVAGGKNHDVQMNASYGSTGADCYTTDYYKTGRMGHITVVRNIFPRGILRDSPPTDGEGNKFQN